jgi:predicted phosphodiesterase
VRYALLADVHGNLPGLRAALYWLSDHRIDRYVVAGDLVGYGPFPNECVETLAGLGAVCVAGNHDLIALGALSDDRCIPLARDSLAWTERMLAPETREYLARLPLRTELPGGLVVTHGALDDPQEYTVTDAQAASQLRLVDAAAVYLVLGHTHRAAAYALTSGRMSISGGRCVDLSRPDRYLVNPGSVGQSRGYRARVAFAVLDTDRAEATFVSTTYDVSSCRRALRRAGLSPRSCHLRPTPRRVARRVARSLTAGVSRLAAADRSVWARDDA